MNEAQAEAVAKALRGETWQSGGDIWLVVFRRSNGKVVVLSDEVVKGYDSEDAFEEDRASATLLLH
jgi:hypothetical protein